MSRGTKVVLAYAPQPTVDTVPTTAWKILPRVTDSLNNAMEMTESETINDSRVKTAGAITSATAEGDVEVEFIQSTYDDLLAAAAGNEWVANVLTFGGDVVKAFAVEKKHADINQYHYWKGMQVNTFKLDIPESGFIGMTFGFIGRGYEPKTAAVSKTPEAAKTSPKATSLNVGDIKINGESMKNLACVTAFSFELTNNIENQSCLGGGLYGSNLLAMLQDMTGSMTLAYSAKAQSILDTQLTGAPVKIEATITFPNSTDSYTLTIPKAQISGDLPSGGKDKLDATLSYSVYADLPADLPSITRVVTVTTP